jgi:hypothetical protein
MLTVPVNNAELSKRLMAEISAALVTLREIRASPQRRERDVIGLVEAENHLEAADRAINQYLRDRDKT